jgi:hypothetical protein
VGLRKPAESGIDAVRRLAASDDAGHGGRTAVDGRPGRVRNRQAGAAARQIAQGGEIERIAEDEHRAIMPEGS